MANEFVGQQNQNKWNVLRAIRIMAKTSMKALSKRVVISLEETLTGGQSFR